MIDPTTKANTRRMSKHRVKTLTLRFVLLSKASKTPLQYHYYVLQVHQYNTVAGVCEALYKEYSLNRPKKNPFHQFRLISPNLDVYSQKRGKEFIGSLHLKIDDIGYVLLGSKCFSFKVIENSTPREAFKFYPKVLSSINTPVSRQSNQLIDFISYHNNPIDTTLDYQTLTRLIAVHKHSRNMVSTMHTPSDIYSDIVTHCDNIYSWIKVLSEKNFEIEKVEIDLSQKKPLRECKITKIDSFKYPCDNNSSILGAFRGNFIFSSENSIFILDSKSSKTSLLFSDPLVKEIRGAVFIDDVLLFLTSSILKIYHFDTKTVTAATKYTFNLQNGLLCIIDCLGLHFRNYNSSWRIMRALNDLILTVDLQRQKYYLMNLVTKTFNSIPEQPFISNASFESSLMTSNDDVKDVEYFNLGNCNTSLLMMNYEPSRSKLQYRYAIDYLEWGEGYCPPERLNEELLLAAFQGVLKPCLTGNIWNLVNRNHEDFLGEGALRNFVIAIGSISLKDWLFQYSWILATGLIEAAIKLHPTSPHKSNRSILCDRPGSEGFEFVALLFGHEPHYHTNIMKDLCISWKALIDQFIENVYPLLSADEMAASQKLLSKTLNYNEHE